MIKVGKIANMLYMIDLLNTGNIYTLKELSAKIGVTERMIRYYKDEICNIELQIVDKKNIIEPHLPKKMGYLGK